MNCRTYAGRRGERVTTEERQRLKDICALGDAAMGYNVGTTLGHALALVTEGPTYTATVAPAGEFDDLLWSEAERKRQAHKILLRMRK